MTFVYIGDIVCWQLAIKEITGITAGFSAYFTASDDPGWCDWGRFGQTEKVQEPKLRLTPAIRQSSSLLHKNSMQKRLSLFGPVDSSLYYL